MLISHFKKITASIILSSLSILPISAIADWQMKFPEWIPQGYRIDPETRSILNARIECNHLKLRVTDQLVKLIKAGEPQHIHLHFVKSGPGAADTKWVYILIPPEVYRPNLNIYPAQRFTVDPKQLTVSTDSNTSTGTRSESITFTLEKIGKKDQPEKCG